MNGDGTYTLTQYQTPVNYQLADGTWAPIDTTLVDAPGTTYDVQNAAGDYTAKIPQDPATTPVDFSHDGAWVTMQMHGAGTAAPTVDGSTATLDDVAKTNGVSYQAVDAGLKENISLDAAPTGSVSYVYDISASAGLTPTIDNLGTIDFTAADGSVPVTIPAAEMHDSAAQVAESNAITYALAAQPGGWQLTLTPDLSWLTDPARVYPVTIDPTLSKQYDSGDCYIQSAVPDTAECGDGAVWLRAGGPDATHRVRSLVKFNVYQLQQALPAGAVITQAKAELHMSSGLNSTAAEYAMYQAGAPFDNYATWNSSGGAGGLWVGGSPIASTESSTWNLSGGTPGFRGFDITATVQGWVNGTTPNNGLVLTQTIGTSVNNEILFESSSAYNSLDVQPYLTVTYDQAPNTPNTFSIGPNVVTGSAPNYATTLTPELSTSVSDRDGNQALTATFTLTDADGNAVWSGTSPSTAEGGVASVTVPDEYLDPGQNYTVAIQTSDGTATSGTYTDSFSTDIYRGTVPAQPCAPTDPDTCISTNSTEPIYTSTEVDPGQTVALSADPSSAVDDSTDELFGSITTTGSASGSLYVYDGDYAQPAVPSLQYATGTSTQTISLTPADDGTVTITNAGSAAVSLSITADTIETSASEPLPADLAAWSTATPPPDGTTTTCTPTQMSAQILTEGATDTTAAAPDVCLPPVGSERVPGRRVINDSFPDPGFLKANGEYYLYGTTAPSLTKIFPMSYSSYADNYYAPLSAAMQNRPGWVSTATTGNHQANLWAPEVVSIGGQYVMYYTGQSASEQVNCIGVAVSSSPFGYFVPVNNNSPLICDNNALAGYEAIDPFEFETLAGNRYLIYKTSHGNGYGWAIKYIQLNSAGTALARGATLKSLIPAKSLSAIMEAPSLIRHGGKIWLFTSRQDYQTCDYYTSVWASSDGMTGKYKRVIGSWMSQVDPTYACGPGGATVGAGYVAYHAWQGGPGTATPPGKRVAYVSPISWGANGDPTHP